LNSAGTFIHPARFLLYYYFAYTYPYYGAFGLLQANILTSTITWLEERKNDNGVMAKRRKPKITVAVNYYSQVTLSITDHTNHAFSVL